MAFSASAAQGSTWMVSGQTLTGSSTKVLEASVVAPSVSLLAKIAGTEFQFACTGGSLINAKLEKEGKISEGFRAKFTGCTTSTRKSSGESYKLQGSCVPYNKPETLEEQGVIETLELKGQLKLHENGEKEKVEGVTVIESLTGGLSGHLETFSMPECAISEEVKVFGKVALVDSGGNVGLEEEKKVHNSKNSRR